MINWNDIKEFNVTDIKIDFAKLDPTKLDLTKLDVRNLDMPKFDMPELPKFDMPELPADVDRLTGFARDAAYASVGAVVVATQKLDERRRDVTEQVTEQVRKVVDTVA